MAHNVDFSNGQANFAHVGNKAWHGLGQQLEAGADLQTWALAAGFDWECQPIQSEYNFNGQMIASDNYHMVRSDTGASLGCMTSRYKPVQPRDVLAFFKDFVSVDERFALETAGVLKGGKVLWALAKFQEDMEAGGDKHVPYVCLTTSYDGTLATTALATTIRVVCNNTLTAAQWSKDSAQVKVRHATRWTETVAADARDRLAAIADTFQDYKRMADALVQVKMSQQATEQFLKTILLGKDADEKLEGKRANARNQLDNLFNAYSLTVKEGTPVATGWAALNAVTRYVDHERTTRDHGDNGVAASRMASSFYGSGAALKASAIEYLTEYAEAQDDTFSELLAKPVKVKGGLQYA